MDSWLVWRDMPPPPPSSDADDAARVSCRLTSAAYAPLRASRLSCVPTSCTRTCVVVIGRAWAFPSPGGNPVLPRRHRMSPATEATQDGALNRGHTGRRPQQRPHRVATPKDRRCSGAPPPICHSFGKKKCTCTCRELVPAMLSLCLPPPSVYPPPSHAPTFSPPLPSRFPPTNPRFQFLHPPPSRQVPPCHPLPPSIQVKSSVGACCSVKGGKIVTPSLAKIPGPASSPDSAWHTCRQTCTCVYTHLHPSLVDHHNLVRVLHRRQPMRNHERGPTAHHAVEGVLHHCLKIMERQRRAGQKKGDLMPGNCPSRGPERPATPLK
eukprot:362137-Chlamydomonas_euryale.AAC.3